MPAARARASFEPIPPDFDVRALVESNEHFQYVDRISCDMIDDQGFDAFDKLVYLHVVKGGRPLIIDGYQARLDEWTFSSKWLQDNHGEKVENARNLMKKDSITLTVGHYMRNMGKLTDQFFESADNFMDKNRQRIYLKDIDSPQVWIDKLREHLPPNLFYLNESTGEIGGPGASNEIAPGVGQRKGRGIAPAGDLMSSLPPAMRAENLMCYIGHEGTYTPAHREMCASIGHNIMVESSGVVSADGTPERPGSSVWFMTESKDRQTVSEYWLSVLGHDIETENHFAQIAAWKKAPFTVYIVEQRAGDFLLIPPLAPHQVWNRGSRTMKVAWNRTTVDTLEMALDEALPRARQVCRDEQYKNKAIVYYTLHKYHGLLSKTRDFMRTARSPEEQAKLTKSPRIRALQKDYKRLFRMFKDIMLSEMFAPESPTERNMSFLPFDSNVTCAYCRGNIFNRFLTCQNCDDVLGTPEPEPYDICMECYAMGRSCGCISKLRWAEQFKWKELVQKYENWRRLYIELDDNKITEHTSLPLPEERSKLSTRTLAQICQDQLKRRPFVDVHKQQPDEGLEESEGEQIDIGEDGTVKRKKKKRSEAWLKNNKSCHVCQHRHPRWKMADCACGRHWCYGTLFRGYEIMPQHVMEQPGWRCPHCQGICSAGGCRRDPRQKPHEPKGTLLGHDTRAVADARSVESLVDFSVSNLNWLKEDSQSIPKRLQQRQLEAHREKVNGNHIEDDEANETAIGYSPTAADNAIDPALEGASSDLVPMSDSFVDPALRRAIAHEGQSSDSVANLMNRQGSEDPFADYQPAHQAGFIAPSALMHEQPDGEHEPDDVTFFDADESALLNSLGKRGFGDEDGDDVIKKTPVKRARYDRPVNFKNNKPVSGASKQFRKDLEKRALEEARKKGRYIQASAALKGKTKLVMLKIPSARLREVQSRLDRTGVVDDLLRSDLAPPPVSRAVPRPKASASKARTRERDEVFATRKKGRRPLDEESDLSAFDSDEDFGQVSFGDGALEETAGGDKRRRISSWQQRRAAENDALPEDDEAEMDADRVERDRRNRRSEMAKERSQNYERNTAGRFSGKTTKIRPSVHFDVPAADASSNEDNDEEGGDHNEHQRTAAAALALDGAGDEADEDDDLFVKPVSSATAAATTNGARQKPGRSIMARRGKKVKIVSASRRHTTGPGGVASAKMVSATFTPANQTP